MKRWLYSSSVIIIMILIIPLVLHEQIRRSVSGLVNSYPVSAVINKLQQASTPSNDAAYLKKLGKRDVRY